MAALNHRTLSREYRAEPAEFPGGRGRGNSLPAPLAISLKSRTILARYAWETNPERLACCEHQDHPWFESDVPVKYIITQKRF